MKKNMIKLIMAGLVLCVSIFLAACSDRNDAQIPVGIQDVYGDYKGKLIVSEGNKGIVTTDGTIDFSVQDSIILFKEFPIKEIVKAVIKDSAKVDTLLAQIGKVEYKLHHTPKVNTTNNTVELSFMPKELVIKFPVENMVKTAIVTFDTRQDGYYTGYDRVLKFGLVAEKVLVDGVPLFPFEVIKYDFPYSVKN